MYRAVSRDQLSETLLHLRNVFRKSNTNRSQADLAHEAREIFTRNLLSNLAHLGNHPMPQVLAEAAHHFQLTMDGAHQLFGYDLRQVREYDFALNEGRTRIIESYPFQQDLPVEVPLRLGEDAAFGRTSFMRDLVRAWQTDLPIRGIRGPQWQRPGTFYVQIGTEDSLGSSLPPGTIAAVEPVEEQEFWHPDSRHIYLLQFGNGYLCSGCYVAGHKLILNLSDTRYNGPDEFRYPDSVRIVGRVRNFALALPMPESRRLRSLPNIHSDAPLLMPWQYPSLSKLLFAKSRRFRRSPHEIKRVKEAVEGVLERTLSERTERRYRGGATASMPHVNGLIELSLMHMVRYSDVLGVLGLFHPDKDHYSLETLMTVDELKQIPLRQSRAHSPQPEHRWQAALTEWGEWSTLLSMKFPRLQPLQDQVIRLHQTGVFNGLDPLLPPGTILLLDDASSVIDTRLDHRKPDWARPIYALRRDADIYCGYLEADAGEYILVPHPRGRTQSLTFARHEIREVRRAIGAAVPL